MSRPFKFRNTIFANVIDKNRLNPVASIEYRQYRCLSEQWAEPTEYPSRPYDRSGLDDGGGVEDHLVFEKPFASAVTRSRLAMRRCRRDEDELFDAISLALLHQAAGAFDVDILGITASTIVDDVRAMNDGPNGRPQRLGIDGARKFKLEDTRMGA
jgi:hypothetical protein